MKKLFAIASIAGLIAFTSGSAHAFSTNYDHYSYGDNVYAINNAIHDQYHYGYKHSYGHDFGNFYYYGGYTSYHNPYKPPRYGYQPYYQAQWAPVNCRSVKVKRGCDWVWEKICTRKW